MSEDLLLERIGRIPHAKSDGREANERVAVLMLAERLYTVEEYTQLCIDMGRGKVEIRRYEDGIVLVRE